MGVNSLPKTVAQQRHDCDLNPSPSVPEFSTLTTRLPSRPYNDVLIVYWCRSCGISCVSGAASQWSCRCWSISALSRYLAVIHSSVIIMQCFTSYVIIQWFLWPICCVLRPIHFCFFVFLLLPSLLSRSPLYHEDLILFFLLLKTALLNFNTWSQSHKATSLLYTDRSVAFFTCRQLHSCLIPGLLFPHESGMSTGSPILGDSLVCLTHRQTMQCATCSNKPHVCDACKMD